MSPAHVLEPTYAAIKQKLLEAAWAPGARLESARIADMVGVSMTPVRDSLNRLVGERLVDLRPGFGFHVPRLCPFDLRELMELNLALMRLALNRMKQASLAEIRTDNPDLALRSRALFNRIAHEARNEALEDAIESLSDRLHPFRRLETQVLGDVEQELAELEATVTGLPDRPIAAAVRRYHQRRISAAPRLVAQLQQAHASWN
jgi:DNA-binding GntR family transcriptional regulator